MRRSTAPATPKISNRIKINVRPCSDRSLSSQNWNECQTKQGNKGYKNDEHHRITSRSIRRRATLIRESGAA